MHRFFALGFGLFFAMQTGAVLAQTNQGFLITIKADGTCAAAGLHVPCREIGHKLREAGIPPNAKIRLGADKGASYEAVSAALESVMHAGFSIAKVGFVNTKPDR